MRVILVHGLLRTRFSLARLARALRSSGCRTEAFAYLAARESFDAIARRLAARLARFEGGWCAVGHSLGGLVLREAIAALPAGGRPRRLIQLGTPNRSPRLARRLRRTLPFRVLHGDCGQLLADAGRMARIARPDVAVTVIAGTGGWRGPWSPFGDVPNDGLVAVDETALEGAESIELPVRHTFMMNDARVRRIVLERCDCGWSGGGEGA